MRGGQGETGDPTTPRTALITCPIRTLGSEVSMGLENSFFSTVVSSSV